MRNENCKQCKLCESAETICLIPEFKRSDIMIIGEAPGKQEDEQNKVFIGPAGKLLDELLAANDLDRKKIYLTNAVLCRPPGNRTPKKSEIKACRTYLLQQIEKVKPKFVLLLGNVPLESVLDKKGIKKLRGKPTEINGIIYLPTYHPAFIIRDERQRKTLEMDIALFAEIIREGEIPREKGLNYTIVNNEDDLKVMMKDLYGDISYDIETTCLYPWAEEARINSFGFGTEHRQWILPVEHEYSTWSRKRIKSILLELDKRVQDGEIRWIAQNGKFDMLWTWVQFGIRWDVYFDTMMANFMLDENSLHGLKYLSQVYFGAMDYDIDQDTKLGKVKDVNDKKEVARVFNSLAYYQAHDLYYTRNLKYKLNKKLIKDPDVNQVFKKIIMPCVNLFIEIEYRGVYIDLRKMDEAETFLVQQKETAEKELSKFVPKDMEMNWGSPQQIAHLLFDVLKLPVLEKTAKGKPSTSESVIKRIDHPMVNALLKFRESKQQLSFFIEGWKPFLDHDRLHPSFKLHGTVTGRLSCQNPNLQQVPRDPRIRQLISAPPGWTLIEADLSQIELRIAAELAGEKEMIRCFELGIDVHWRTMLKSLNSDTGHNAQKVIQTAELYCLRVGLHSDRASSEILLGVLKANKNRVNTETLISTCYKYWSDKKAGSREWGQLGEREKRQLEGWLSDMAKETFSQDLLRAMWDYTTHLFTSQGRKPSKLEKIQFGDALQIMSCIGPSIAQELCEDWKELRKKAKAVGFGYLYGMWWKKFRIYARDSYGVDVSDKEAEQSRKDFFDLYRGFPEWHVRQKMFARKYGYVTSLAGRKRRLPAAMAREDSPERGSAERQAINSPVQSFASDLNLMAALQLRKEYSTDILYIVGTVHDALLLEVKNEYVPQVYKRILEVMSQPSLLDKMGISLQVPIEAEAKIGPWSKGVKLEDWNDPKSITK